MRHLNDQHLKTQFLTELHDDINQMLSDGWGIKDTIPERANIIKYIESSVENFWTAYRIHMNITHNLGQPEAVRQNRMEENNYYISYNDPVGSCAVYKTQGCSHIDGMLCDMETCTILKSFIDDFLKEEGTS